MSASDCSSGGHLRRRAQRRHVAKHATLYLSYTTNK